MNQFYSTVHTSDAGEIIACKRARMLQADEHKSLLLLGASSRFASRYCNIPNWVILVNVVMSLFRGGEFSRGANCIVGSSFAVAEKTVQWTIRLERV